VVHSGTPADTVTSDNELVRKFVNGESDDPRTVITHY
jgi:hypothetical protein